MSIAQRVVARHVQQGSYSAELFHGTDAEFDKFDSRFFGTSTDEGLLGQGVYFSTDPNVAKKWKFRLKAKVRLSRPLRLSYPKWGADKSRLMSEALELPSVKRGRALTSAAKREGHDGVVLDYSPVGYSHQEVVAFSPRATRILEVQSK